VITTAVILSEAEDLNSATVILSEAKDLLNFREILRRCAPQDDRGKAALLRMTGGKAALLRMTGGKSAT
jgi:hypothetical protein